LMACCALAAWPVLAQQPPAADRGKPEEVGKAYLEACRQGDRQAAAAFLTEEIGKQVGSLMEGAPPEFSLDAFITELLLMPITRRNVTYTPGELVVEGDTARLPVTATVTLPQTLVLHKGADGNWIVDLEQSVIASTGLPESQFLQSRQKAEAQACLSNLKQMGLAVLMWAQDHDEMLPPAENWTEELDIYVKNRDVFRCPAASSTWRSPA